jgi:hypothetical protein
VGDCIGGSFASEVKLEKMRVTLKAASAVMLRFLFSMGKIVLDNLAVELRIIEDAFHHPEWEFGPCRKALPFDARPAFVCKEV